MASFDKAVRHIEDHGKEANSPRFRYRFFQGRWERLNGWWQPLQWPLDQDEIDSKAWVLHEPPYNQSKVQEGSNG